MSKDTRPVYMGTYEIHKKLVDEKLHSLRLDQLDNSKQAMHLRNDFENYKSSIEKKLLTVAILTGVNAIAILLQLIFG
jgi:hypothetical protein